MTTPDTNKPIPAPRALTPAELDRLVSYEDMPDDTKTEEQLLDELRLRGIHAEHHKHREAVIIRRMLPAETEAPRGLFTRVAEASRYTREYVSRIRHRKVPTMNYAPRAGA